MKLKNYKFYSIIVLGLMINFVGLASIQAIGQEYEFGNVSLSGYVWDDINNNGVIDGEETGIFNSVVSAINPITGETVLQTESDADGKYVLTGLTGNYNIEYSIYDGYQIINSTNNLVNLQSGLTQNLELSEKLTEKEAIIINVGYTTIENANELYNVWFNEDFNKKFNEEFNAKFNSDFNDAFNENFNTQFNMEWKQNKAKEELVN